MHGGLNTGRPGLVQGPTRIGKMCEVKQVLIECGRNNVQVEYLHMNTLPGGLLDALTLVIDSPTKFTVIATGSVTATAPSFTVCEGLISIAAHAG
jgi:hypothetical protein